jgi:DNA helicase-2/ATP-dependent DNA helicase PcrA
MPWPIFRVVAQPADDLAFERIVNTPKRGLGEARCEGPRRRPRPRHPDARRRARTRPHRRAEAKPRKSLTDVVEMFTRWQGMLESTPGHELAETILDESGYTEMWQNDRSADAPTRLENLKELVETISSSNPCAPSSSTWRWSWTPTTTPISTPSRS